MVEWKRLGDVCKVLRGKRLTKSQLNESEGYPVLHGGSTPMGYYNESNRKANTTVVVNTGNAGSVFFYDKEFWSSDACFSLYPNKEINDKFLYLYVYGCERILKGKIRAGAMPTIDAKAVEDLQIPIPSLSEQSRIVSILDTFTASIENLKEQIAERRKQYEYEREKLLDLEGKEGVEMKKLGEVCVIKNGYTPSTKNPDFWDNGTLPWFTLEDIRKNGRILTDAIKHITPLGVKTGGLFPKESIIVSTTATIGEYALIKTDFLCNQQITGLSIKEAYQENLLSKFLYYLSYGIGRWCQRNVNGGGSLLIVSTSKLNNMVIPVPSLEEQSRIVSILDTFEASIANLEAQLELRQKQYEYYRNQLLTFDN